VTIDGSLNLSEFTNYILSYGLTETGELDLTKLSVEVVETLEEEKRLVEDLTDLD